MRSRRRVSDEERAAAQAVRGRAGSPPLAPFPPRGAKTVPPQEGPYGRFRARGAPRERLHGRGRRYPRRFVASHPKYPVGAADRPSPSAKQHGPIALSAERRTPPKPPTSLRGRRERALWRELTSAPVAALWSTDDRPLVERLILLRVRLEREGADAPGWLHSAITSAEDRLLLNPRSRRTAGVAIVEDARVARLHLLGAGDGTFDPPARAAVRAALAAHGAEPASSS